MSLESKSSISQVCLSPSWGGLEICTIKHALWFKEVGYPVSGVCLKDSPLEKAFKENQIPTLSLTKRGYLSIKDSILLHHFLKEQNTQVIFCHHLKDLWRLRLSLWGLSQITLIGFARMFLRNVNKKDFLHRYIYSRMKWLVSLTEIQKESLLHCLPISSDQVKVIPDSVDVDLFRPSHRNEKFRREVYGLHDGEKAIGLVGRLDPQKGSKEFIEAAKNLIERHQHLRFFLIGKETPDTPGFEKKLKDYVSLHGLDKNIIFLGHRSDVHFIIANLDLFEIGRAHV